MEGAGIYSEQIHAERLVEMLNETEDACSLCPATAEFSPGMDPYHCWDTGEVNPCQVCQEFLDLKYIPFAMPFNPKCPCDRLGEEAIQRTRRRLIELGYLEQAR